MEPIKPTDFYFPTAPDTEGGISVRTHLAAMAMQGLISAIYSNPEYRRMNDIDENSISYMAVDHADAIIRELNKTTKEG